MVNKPFIKSFFPLLFCIGNLTGTIKFNGPLSTLSLDQANSGLTLSTSMPITYGTLKLRNTTGTTDGNIASATGAETITFTDGSIQLGTTTVDLSGGTYDPKTGSTRDALSLGNGQVMSVSDGTTIFNDVSVANGATATILGYPTFVSSVSLGNSSSVLNLAIQNKLNKDIVLNSGKLVLQDNLELADGVRVWGPGTVDINYQSLRFGTQVNSSVFSQDLTFWRAKDITLNGPVTLAGNWSFLTNSTDNESVINGNGNILTLNGGNLVVGDATAGHTLYISDLHIKGVSTPQFPTLSSISQASYLALWQRNDYMTQSQWQNYGIAAYTAGFAVVYTQSCSNGFSIWDGTSTTASSSPKAYFVNADISGVTNHSYGSYTDSIYSLNLVTGGVTFLNSGSQAAARLDTDEDGNFMKLEGGSIYDSLGNKLTGLNGYGYFTAAKTSTQMIFAAVTAQVNKYSGGGSASVDGFTTVYATGYNSIRGISATTDGYLWIIDYDTDNIRRIYKTAGGAKSTSSQIITLPGGYQPIDGTICVKGTSNKLNAVCIGSATSSPAYGEGRLFYSSDGVNFVSLGDIGAGNIYGIGYTAGMPAVSVGHQGSIAFIGPSYNNYPTFMFNPDGLVSKAAVPTSHPIFIKGPVITGGKFSLYDGGATDANRGKVVLSNVTLELADNYTHSAGRITFKGDNCKIITGGNKTFNVASANTPVEVDSVALTYDTLGGTNSSPFTGTAVTLTNGGIVRSASQPGETIIDANLYNGSSAPTLLQNYSLSQKNGGVTVTNATGAASQTVTINGGNYFWDFPGGTTSVLTIADKVTVTLTNVILKNFSLSNVSFGGASAALVFGDGCVIELGADQSLTTGQGAWLFSGNATIRAMGQTITLNNTDSIRQNVANKTLTISNTILKSLSTLSLGCASLGKVVLSNSTLQINTGGFTWSTGNLDISGYSKLSAMNITTSGGSANFNLTTSGQMTVTSGSTLEFGRAINFAYSPTTTGDTGGITGTIAKRHFALGSSGDASATLYASNCSIDSTAVGMALDRGNLVVDNKVVLTASTTASYESELGSALNVEILSGSVLRLDGGVKYTVTTV